MIGILLISHAHIASETVAAVEHILGKQTGLKAMDMPNSDVLCHEQEHFNQLLASVDGGQGVLVMVDLFGATPCNVVLDSVQPISIEVVAGFNVPAVIKAVSLRNDTCNLRELAQASVKSGQQYLQLTNDKNLAQEMGIAHD